MEEIDLLQHIIGQNQIQKIIEMNQKTEAFGLTLSQEDAKLLVERRMESLQNQQRIEFGDGILPKLIFTFCDSPYMDESNYVEVITRLQDIFYEYKNESMDELTDDELLEYMRKAFDNPCEGSLEYLEDTVLEGIARDLRREGKGFFRMLNESEEWDVDTDEF